MFILLQTPIDVVWRPEISIAGQLIVFKSPLQKLRARLGPCKTGLSPITVRAKAILLFLLFCFIFWC